MKNKIPQEIEEIKGVRSSVYDSIKLDIIERYGKQFYEDFVGMLKYKGFQEGQKQKNKWIALGRTQMLEKVKEKIKKTRGIPICSNCESRIWDKRNPCCPTSGKRITFINKDKILSKLEDDEVEK
jgi:hypothetical protein